MDEQKRRAHGVQSGARALLSVSPSDYDPSAILGLSDDQDLTEDR